MHNGERNTRLRRAITTMALTAAITGAWGAGTASAHETEPAPSGGPLGAVQASTGSLVGHLEEYHLSQPTWEVESLLTSPKENFQVHQKMLDGMVGPLVGLLP